MNRASGYSTLRPSLAAALLAGAAAGGADRARKLCADELAKDDYLTGCPVRSKRY